jgi:hypothetical protein
MTGKNFDRKKIRRKTSGLHGTAKKSAAILFTLVAARDRRPAYLCTAPFAPAPPGRGEVSSY